MVIGAGKVLVDFVDGVGGGSERAIGFTKGGNVFEVTPEYLDVDADGSYGKVKGLDIIIGCAAKMTVNLAEVLTTQNLLLMMGGLQSADRTWTFVTGEYLGTGLELTSGIVPGGGVNIDNNTVKVYYTHAALGIPHLAVSGTDYNLNVTTREITEIITGAILDTDEITVAYSYDSSASADNFDVLTLNHVDDDDYHDWALVGRPSSSALTKACYWVLRDALANGGMTINLQKKQNLVAALAIEAHWDRTNLDLSDAPFEIWVPQA
jgi:hypothetical protein